jgi:hypothetical protein
LPVGGVELLRGESEGGDPVEPGLEEPLLAAKAKKREKGGTEEGLG